MVVAVWGRGNWRALSGVPDLDAVLAEVAGSTVLPQVIGLYPPAYLAPDFVPGERTDLPALQFGVGHPPRGFLLWLGADGGIGYEERPLPWPPGVDEIQFEYGGDPVFCGLDRACVSPATALRAARAFVISAVRPANVLWRQVGAG